MKIITMVCVLFTLTASVAAAQSAPGICPALTNAQATAIAKATAKHLRAEGKQVKMASCAILTAPHSKAADINCVFIVNGKTIIKNIPTTNRCALHGSTGLDPWSALLGEVEAGL